MNQIEEHKKLVDYVHDVYVRKNHDYGDSFSKLFSKYGMLAAMVRMEDKWNRMENLAGGTKQEVSDESIRDTCLDLANYCLMTVMELDRKKAVENQKTFEQQANSTSVKECIADPDKTAETDIDKITIPESLEKEKKPLDEGKVMALHKAKWSQKKIADEMGCSQGRISQIIKAHKK